MKTIIWPLLLATVMHCSLVATGCCVRSGARMTPVTNESTMKPCNTNKQCCTTMCVPTRTDVDAESEEAQTLEEAVAALEARVQALEEQLNACCVAANS